MLTTERYNAGQPPQTFSAEQQRYLKQELQAIQRSFARATVEQTFNTSSDVLNTGFAVDTWVGGSDLLVPAMGWQHGSMLEWVLVATKTAAGLVPPAFTVRGGGNRSTADTSITTLTSNAQTAATDSAIITITAALQGLAAGSGTLHVTLFLQHMNAATGFANVGNVIVDQNATVTVPSYANQYLSLSLNAGASAAWTITQVRAHALW